MNELWSRRPSPAMVVAVIALIVALAGTAYAAQTINGGAIKKQTIGGGKLKPKTLTGFQVNVNKLGTVPFAKVATASRVTGPLGQLVALTTAAVEGNEVGALPSKEGGRSLLNKLNLKGLVAKKPVAA